MKKVFFVVSLLFLFSCKEDVLPKPKAQLRLDYSKAKYEFLTSENCSFAFEINKKVAIKTNRNCGFELHYPKMKATVYITYKQVNNDINSLLRDAQKLTYDHATKADEIITQPFIHPNKKVYGMFSEVGGNAATNAQFYVTDSVHNFLYGSMYFYTKPNFDSVLPAANYIKNDIKRLMESVVWKN